MAQSSLPILMPRFGPSIWSPSSFAMGTGLGLASYAQLARSSAQRARSSWGWVDGPDGGLCMVGQLVPPVVALIPAAEIESLHRIVGAVGGERHLSENDRAALAIIAPFRREGSHPRIGLNFGQTSAGAVRIRTSARAGGGRPIRRPRQVNSSCE